MAGTRREPLVDLARVHGLQGHIDPAINCLDQAVKIARNPVQAEAARLAGADEAEARKQVVDWLIEENIPMCVGT